MFEFQLIPSSTGEKKQGDFVGDHHIQFTTHENIDEAARVHFLNEQLEEIEVRQQIRREALVEVEYEAKQLKLAVKEKAAILQRVKSLWLLYKVQESLDVIQTKEEAAAMVFSLSKVQANPFKAHLILAIEKVAECLPTEKRSRQEEVMELGLNEAGNDFINLGKVGRTFVVEKVVATDAPPIEALQLETKRLNDSVVSLCTELDHVVVRAYLEKLPLTAYRKVASEHREAFVRRLMEAADWTDLLTLDYAISRIYQTMIAEVHTEQALAKQPAPTIDVELLVKK